MTKYHVNPATGDANPCKARYQCRYGAGMPHFSSKDDASKFFAKALEDSTVYLYEKENGHLKGIREGYLQGKLYPQDLRVGDIVRRRVTVGNTTFSEFHEIMEFDRGSALERKISSYDWKPVHSGPLSNPGPVVEREVSFPMQNTAPSAMVFILRKKPKDWNKNK